MTSEANQNYYNSLEAHYARQESEDRAHNNLELSIATAMEEEAGRQVEQFDATATKGSGGSVFARIGGGVAAGLALGRSLNAFRQTLAYPDGVETVNVFASHESEIARLLAQAAEAKGYLDGLEFALHRRDRWLVEFFLQKLRQFYPKISASVAGYRGNLEYAAVFKNLHASNLDTFNEILLTISSIIHV